MVLPNNKEKEIKRTPDTSIELQATSANSEEADEIVFPPQHVRRHPVDDDCCTCSSEEGGCKGCLTRTWHHAAHSLDFIDDDVRSKWLTVCVFCAVLDTVSRFNTGLKQSAKLFRDFPLLFFIFYMILTALFSLMMSTILFANNPKSNKCWLWIGCVLCTFFTILKYLDITVKQFRDAFVPPAFQSNAGNAGQQGSLADVAWGVQVFGMGASGLACLLIVVMLFYMLCKEDDERNKKAFDYKEPVDRVPVPEHEKWQDKGKWKDRERMLTNLRKEKPENLDRSAERELDNYTCCERVGQFFWPESDFDIGQELSIPAKVLATIWFGLITSIIFSVRSGMAFTSWYDEAKKVIRDLEPVCANNDIGLVSDCYTVSEEQEDLEATAGYRLSPPYENVCNILEEQACDDMFESLNQTTWGMMCDESRTIPVPTNDIVLLVLNWEVLYDYLEHCFDEDSTRRLRLRRRSLQETSGNDAENTDEECTIEQFLASSIGQRNVDYVLVEPVDGVAYIPIGNMTRHRCNRTCEVCTVSPHNSQIISTAYMELELNQQELYRYTETIYHAAVVALGFALLYCVVGFLLIARAWRKKVIELWYEAPTYFYRKRDINIGRSFQFVGIIYYHIFIGAFLFFLTIWFLGVVLGTDEFWSKVVGENAFYILGYILYILFLEALLKPWLKTYVTDGDFVRPGWEPCWHYMSFVIELLYIPIALFFPILVIIINNIVVVSSLLRPDILTLPRGLEVFQFGHMIFVANCKAYVYRIKQMYLGKDEERGLEAEIAYYEKKKKSYINNNDWHSCIETDTYLLELREKLEFIKRDIKEGDEAYYQFDKDPDALGELVEVKKINKARGKITILRKHRRSSSLTPSIEFSFKPAKFRVFVSPNAKTISVCDPHLSWPGDERKHEEAQTLEMGTNYGDGESGDGPISGGAHLQTDTSDGLDIVKNSLAM